MAKTKNEEIAAEVVMNQFFNIRRHRHWNFTVLGQFHYPFHQMTPIKSMEISIDWASICIVGSHDLKRNIGTGYVFIKNNMIVTAKHVVVDDTSGDNRANRRRIRAAYETLLESMLDGELNNHLEEEKATGQSNRRNGKSKKTVRSLRGE